MNTNDIMSQFEMNKAYRIQNGKVAKTWHVVDGFPKIKEERGEV
jgi:hypothetical protein